MHEMEGPGPVSRADLPIARPLTLLNRSPGPETRRNSRFPSPSCVAGVSPGRSPFPATREFLRSPEGQHKRPPPAISRKFLIHTSIHISSAVIPRREGFSTGPSTVLSTASRWPRSRQAIVRLSLPWPGGHPTRPGPRRLAPNPRCRPALPGWLGRTAPPPIADAQPGDGCGVALRQDRCAITSPRGEAMCHRPRGNLGTRPRGIRPGKTRA